jgi:hypothetical protein
MKLPYILGTIAGMLLPTLAMAQVSLRPCLEIEDQTKERLDCYDAQIKPAPKKTSAPAKTVNECRFIQEQDERLTCFNKFVTASSKKNTAKKNPKSSK